MYRFQGSAQFFHLSYKRFIMGTMGHQFGHSPSPLLTEGNGQMVFRHLTREKFCPFNEGHTGSTDIFIKPDIIQFFTGSQTIEVKMLESQLLPR